MMNLENNEIQKIMDFWGVLDINSLRCPRNIAVENWTDVLDMKAGKSIK